MSRSNDEDARDKPSAYGTDSRMLEYNQSDSCDSEADDQSNKKNSDDSNNDSKSSCKIWLEVLPSKGGMLLAVLLSEIMTEGLTPAQMNILGNFISAVGSLISYKASRDELDFK